MWRKLLLRQAEEEVSLILARIRGPLQEPASAGLVVLIARVVAGRDQLRADLPRGQQQLIELEMVVAQAAGNRRAPGQVLGDERLHHLALEALLVVDQVIRNAQPLGHAPRVIDIVHGAAAALDLFRHALAPGEAALVPELHGEPDERVPLGLQHGGNGRGVNAAGHGNRDRSRRYRGAH